MAVSSFAQIGILDTNGNFVPVGLRARDVAASDGTTAEAHITDASKHLTTGQTAKIVNALQNSSLGVPNGVAKLDENGVLDASMIPPSVLGGMNYVGTFDPNTGKDNTGAAIPAAQSANKGWYWIAGAAGSYAPPPGSATLTFDVGDWLVSSGVGYNEVDNTTADTAARSMASQAQSTADNAADSANDAMQEALLLDLAYVTSETDLATKNLRPGAMVLMQVNNE